MNATKTCVEELAGALALRKRLEEAKTLMGIIEAVHDAICRIEACGAIGELRSITNDSLAEIHTEVQKIFSGHVIPRAYHEWWERAKDKSAEEILELSEMKNILATSPCFDQNDYGTILMKIGRARTGRSEHRMAGLQCEFDAERRPLPIPVDRLAPWRIAEMKRIDQRIKEIESKRKEWQEKAPDGFTVQKV